MEDLPASHVTLPETNIFAPENGWLEYDPFLLGLGNFSGAFAVSFREGSFQGCTSNLDVSWVSWICLFDSMRMEQVPIQLSSPNAGGEKC